jgi:Fe-S-cluster-containing hydrogenase component 2
VKYLYTYPEKCSGCRQCSISCSLNKLGECNPKKGAINILRDEFERYEIQFVCLQCEEPECTTVCMKSAIAKGEDGIVRVDKDKCIGCRMCVVIKCDLCDGDPVCIKYCSTDAVVYEEESDELVDRRKELAQLILKKD